jgi:ribosomal-protein-alanine N-acetyltransferase
MQDNFTTPRLTLTPLTSNNDAFILELVNSPGWLQFIGDRKVGTLADAQAYIQKMNTDPTIKYWVVNTSGGEMPVEDTSVGVITVIQRDYLEFPDLGFAFLPRHQKSGYAFEASSVILNYLTKVLSHKSVLAITLPNNLTSIRLLKKLGFQFQKKMAIKEESVLLYGVNIT